MSREISIPLDESCHPGASQESVAPPSEHSPLPWSCRRSFLTFPPKASPKQGGEAGEFLSWNPLEMDGLGDPSLENRVTTILRALISSDSPSFKILPKKLDCVALGQPDRVRD